MVRSIKLKRFDGLVIQEVGEELVVFNPLTGQASTLNREASWLWSQLEEERSLEELQQSFAKRFPEDREHSQDLVQHALRVFQTRGLLSETLPPDFDHKVKSRRELLKAAAAVPVVLSMLLGEPAAAASGTCVNVQRPFSCPAGSLCDQCFPPRCSTHCCVNVWNTFDDTPAATNICQPLGVSLGGDLFVDSDCNMAKQSACLNARIFYGCCSGPATCGLCLPGQCLP